MEPSVDNAAVGQGWRLEQTYASLPDVFYAKAEAAPAPQPELVIVNHNLAKELGLDFASVTEADQASLFTGQRLPAGACRLAQAYAGHQFGGFTMLGDGRAMLLGEQRTPAGVLVDVQFKGSGPTMFSRGGDGYAVLGPMLREYIISEGMHHLGIPTTRSLAVATTGGKVFRQGPQPGAILTRVAASHLRVGTFQFAAMRRDLESLRALADYAIQRHDPMLAELSDAERYVELLRAVVKRQAELIASWQHVGFIHGVMNTDNMTISGESIDYGPCAFMNTYHPETVFSSIDHGGRYAYGNQPAIGHWNLARFAESLAGLFDDDQDRAVELAIEVLNEYPTLFNQAWLDGMRRKLGLQSAQEEDDALIQDWLGFLDQAELDFTNAFDDLSTRHTIDTSCGDLTSTFRAWRERWVARLAKEDATPESVAAAMQAVNPAIIPRNHQVEAALAAAGSGDLAVFTRLLGALETPFQRNDYTQPFRDPPPTGGPRYRTYCGT